MKLHVFLEKNNVNLNPSLMQLCLKAIDIMDHSVDSAHDKNHVEEMLTNLHYLINKMPDMQKHINFDVLLLSICWHDTWTSFRKPNNLIAYTLNQIVEGYGSAFLFRKYALNQHIDKKIILKVFYTIVKHSSFQLLPPFSLEAKILIDLDKIEMWNLYRMFKEEQNKVNERVQFFRKFWVRNYYKFIAYKSMYIKNFQIITDKKIKQFDKFVKNFQEKDF